MKFQMQKQVVENGIAGSSSSSSQSLVPPGDVWAEGLTVTRPARGLIGNGELAL